MKNNLTALKIFRIIIFSYLLLVFLPQIAKAIEFMDIDEITPGMKGYGKTVFSGQRIEVFEVEVLGVLKNWAARSDMILVKMSGGPLEKTGIIAGMSGSPVYIKNKLVGAVSHGWSFSKDAIAGVTPINEMLDVLKMDSNIKEVNHIGNKHNTWSASLETQDPVVIDELISHGMLLEDPFSQNSGLQGPFTINLIPIHTPLMVSGFDNRSLKRLGPLFGKMGWFPFQGNVKGSSNFLNKINTFVPGSSIAIEMIRGDLNVSAIGTVTYRDGNDILAFGHPLIQTGTTDLPMSTAYVYTILANQSGSIKMAVPGNVIGRVTQDRKAAVSGRIGEYTKMIPCQTEVKGSLNVKYNFDIVHDKFLTPNLFQMAVESALLATENTLGEKLVNLRLDVDLADREKPIMVENVFYDPGPAWFSLFRIVQPITVLLNNPFRTVDIKSIKLTASILDANNTASIESIRINKKWIKPGDEVYLNIRLRPFKKDFVTIPAKIKIPDDVTRGSRIKITVCDANYSAMLEQSRVKGRPTPTNFEQLVDYIEDEKSNKDLIVRMQLDRKGLTYMGESFPSLPNSFLNIMSQSNQSGITGLRSEIVNNVQTDWFITGKQSIYLFVEKNG